MAGFKIECHVTHFDREEADDVWIPECARRGWIIFTSDKNIEHDPINRQAVIESKARVFFLEEGGARAVLWAAAIIVSKTRIYQIALDTQGPFFANIARETGMMVAGPRIPNGSPDRKSDAATVTRSPFAHFIKF